MSDEAPGRAAGAPPRPPRLGVAAAGAVSLLFAASLVLVFPFGLLIAPFGLVPVAQQVVAGRRSVAVWGWVAALLAATVLAGGGATIVALLAGYGLVVVVPVLSLEAWRATGIGEGRWMALTTAVIACGCVVGVAAAVAPADPVSGVVAAVREAQGRYPELFVTSGRLDLALDSVERTVAWLLPSLGVAYVVTVLFWLRARLPVLGFPMPVEPFERWRNDEWLGAGFAVTGLATLVLSGTPRWVASNLLAAVVILYFTQGLAMIRAHLARLVGRGWLVRWALALLCLQVPLLFVVAALGVADSFADLRPRANPDGRNE